MPPQTWKLLSLIVGAIGLVLLAMMVIVEDEPGALPLALILVGGLGYGFARLRQRRRRQAGSEAPPPAAP